MGARDVELGRRVRAADHDFAGVPDAELDAFGSSWVKKAQDPNTSDATINYMRGIFGVSREDLTDDDMRADLVGAPRPAVNRTAALKRKQGAMLDSAESAYNEVQNKIGKIKQEQRGGLVNPYVATQVASAEREMPPMDSLPRPGRPQVPEPITQNVEDPRELARVQQESGGEYSVPGYGFGVQAIVTKGKDRAPVAAMNPKASFNYELAPGMDILPRATGQGSRVQQGVTSWIRKTFGDPSEWSRLGKAPLSDKEVTPENMATTSPLAMSDLDTGYGFREMGGDYGEGVAHLAPETVNTLANLWGVPTWVVLKAYEKIDRAEAAAIGGVERLIPKLRAISETMVAGEPGPPSEPPGFLTRWRELNEAEAAKNAADALAVEDYADLPENVGRAMYATPRALGLRDPDIERHLAEPRPPKPAAQVQEEALEAGLHGGREAGEWASLVLPTEGSPVFSAIGRAVVPSLKLTAGELAPDTYLAVRNLGKALTRSKGAQLFDDQPASTFLPPMQKDSAESAAAIARMQGKMEGAELTRGLWESANNALRRQQALGGFADHPIPENSLRRIVDEATEALGDEARMRAASPHARAVLDAWYGDGLYQSLWRRMQETGVLKPGQENLFHTYQGQNPVRAAEQLRPGYERELKAGLAEEYTPVTAAKQTHFQWKDEPPPDDVLRAMGTEPKAEFNAGHYEPRQDIPGVRNLAPQDIQRAVQPGEPLGAAPHGFPQKRTPESVARRLGEPGTGDRGWEFRRLTANMKASPSRSERAMMVKQRLMQNGTSRQAAERIAEQMAKKSFPEAAGEAVEDIVIAGGANRKAAADDVARQWSALKADSPEEFFTRDELVQKFGAGIEPFYTRVGEKRASTGMSTVAEAFLRDRDLRIIRVAEEEGAGELGKSWGTEGGIEITLPKEFAKLDGHAAPHDYIMALKQATEAPSDKPFVGMRKLARWLDDSIGLAQRKLTTTQGNPGFALRNGIDNLSKHILSNGDPLSPSALFGRRPPGLDDEIRDAVVRVLNAPIGKPAGYDIVLGGKNLGDAGLLHGELVRKGRIGQGMGKAMAKLSQENPGAGRMLDYLKLGNVATAGNKVANAPGMFVNQTTDDMIKSIFTTKSGSVPAFYSSEEAIRAANVFTRMRRGVSIDRAARGMNRLFVDFGDKSASQELGSAAIPFLKYYSSAPRGALDLALSNPRGLTRLHNLATAIEVQDAQDQGSYIDPRYKSRADFLSMSPMVRNAKGDSLQVYQFDTPWQTMVQTGESLASTPGVEGALEFLGVPSGAESQNAARYLAPTLNEILELTGTNPATGRSTLGLPPGQMSRAPKNLVSQYLTAMEENPQFLGENPRALAVYHALRALPPTSRWFSPTTDTAARLAGDLGASSYSRSEDQSADDALRFLSTAVEGIRRRKKDVVKESASKYRKSADRIAKPAKEVSAREHKKGTAP